MIPAYDRIARMRKSLEWFESDIPLLNLRVKELSPERQQTARQFAAALIDQTRSELHRLQTERRDPAPESNDPPCEPAD